MMLTVPVFLRLAAVTGDILDKDEYDSQGLHKANHSDDKFCAALKLSEYI